MTKTISDYILEGGIKGRKFVDPAQEAIYEVVSIKSERYGGPKPVISLLGKVVGGIYIKNLVLCLEHEEYAQTPPKYTEMTEEEEIKEALGRR